MRKADYTALAGVLRHALQNQTMRAKAAATTTDIEKHGYAIDVLTVVALKCSDKLSMDKAEFLKACGIT